jgi:glycosyltransferase involved in cell wall biosynthesis
MKFTIVIATYNRKKVLQKCVASILEQTHTEFELIVVDDGSNDGTDIVMGEYSDDRIKYIKLDKNYGTATPARNRGIDEMSGNALIIWDSDDVLLPNALSTLDKGFTDFKEVGIVCTSTDFYKSNVKQEIERIDSCLISTDDWFGGKKPADAEIIAIKKEYIEDVRFQSRGIDFMFYAKIIGKHKLNAYYKKDTCGIINLESDNLSLTLLRKKRNNKLSIQRASILDEFIQQYGELYLKGGAGGKLAGHAFGASIGYILNKEYLKARSLMRVALGHSFKIFWLLMYTLLLIPGGGMILNRLMQ